MWHEGELWFTRRESDGTQCELCGTRGSYGSRGGRAMGHSVSCVAREGVVVHEEGERWDTV